MVENSIYIIHVQVRSYNGREEIQNIQISVKVNPWKGKAERPPRQEDKLCIVA